MELRESEISNRGPMWGKGVLDRLVTQAQTEAIMGLACQETPKPDELPICPQFELLVKKGKELLNVVEA